KCKQLHSINKQDNDEYKNNCINKFVILCEPVGQKNIKVVFGRIGISARNYCKRAFVFEDK
ncbi:hypothetical protein, partial [[Flexibacter] sp. ATCC 35208]|uniref:hypothetical protein n=1 Tax=[Flexibacter] sp. ATCC 35208 TaxID=1936242 RepID=UPI0009C6956E